MFWGNIEYEQFAEDKLRGTSANLVIPQNPISEVKFNCEGEVSRLLVGGKWRKIEGQQESYRRHYKT